MKRGEVTLLLVQSVSHSNSKWPTNSNTVGAVPKLQKRYIPLFRHTVVPFLKPTSGFTYFTSVPTSGSNSVPTRGRNSVPTGDNRTSMPTCCKTDKKVLGVPLFRHTVVPLYRHTVVPLYRQAVLPLFRRAVVPLFRHAERSGYLFSDVWQYLDSDRRYCLCFDGRLYLCFSGR